MFLLGVLGVHCAILLLKSDVEYCEKEECYSIHPFITHFASVGVACFKWLSVHCSILLLKSDVEYCEKE
jgi:hypothetical protein